MSLSDGVSRWPLPRLRRACDQCRARKIRCDRNFPCSHCQQVENECHYSARAAAKKQERERTFLSSKHEKIIDAIDRRVDEIMHEIGDLKIQLSMPPQAPKCAVLVPDSFSSASAASPEINACRDKDCWDKDLLTEGESSLTAQSIFANDFVENATKACAINDPSMANTLEALGAFVNALKQQPLSREMIYQHARDRNSPEQETGMPPINCTMQVLRLAKDPVWVNEFIHVQAFSDLCLKVYFFKDFTAAEFIIVNSGLCWLFTERASAEKSDDYDKSIASCRENLETALSALPLHLPAAPDTVLALIFGAIYTINDSRPSLAWTLTSAAGHMCQTLGYNKIPPTEDAPRDGYNRQFLFWCVYMIDKGLSLRLGRSSVIRDLEIKVPYPATESEVQNPLMDYFRTWVMVATVQGKTYEQLYSPEAQSQIDGVREARVHLLAQELRNIAEDAQKTHVRHLFRVDGSLADFVSAADEVLFSSLLTLIYRAVPVSKESTQPFSPSCIEAARQTLASHQRCMEIIGRDDASLLSPYMHWTILFAPFVPFTVLFCHVIETTDTADLDRLHSFVTSIQPASSLSEASSKLHRLFEVLYDASARYVEVCTMGVDQAAQEAGGVLETYLSAMGLPTPGMLGGFRDRKSQLSSAEGEGVGRNSPLTSGRQDDSWTCDATQLNQPQGSMDWIEYGSQLENWFQNNE
ncbi:hypothetical protein B0T10DRAFT_541511 [Thelonectria olida]|uniref:Zn(2)-C6 fungal-type domain-containing protein n=1 Tax=Thelonectria olida TaxID=1576542 RepID=A0A9P9AEX5_9HYPO|nr:hypothetical protein B0T10DRAFT_541511 [Thelonectria olida]